MPPPAYSTDSLLSYLIATKRYYLEDPTLTIGLKLPPYTHETQFTSLVSATWRKRTDQGVAFLTSTNTLGNGLIFNDEVTSDSRNSLEEWAWIFGMVGLHPGPNLLRRIRDEQFLWFRVAELTYENFAFTAGQRVK